jgi:hypothetical protein
VTVNRLDFSWFLLIAVLIKIFSPQGGYMNAKKSKLTEQFNTGASKESHLQATSKIFSGISVYVNGYTGKLIKLYTATLMMENL